MIIHRTVCITVVALAVASLGIAGCSTNSTSDTANAALAPFHAVPKAHRLSGVRHRAAGAVRGLESHLRARHVGPSGQRDRDDRPVPDRHLAAVWIFERDVITNAEGTWRGSAQGADDPGANPTGEAHFLGEGGYEGLEFHYYFDQTHRPMGESSSGDGSRIDAGRPGVSTAPVAPFHPIPAGTSPSAVRRPATPPAAGPSTHRESWTSSSPADSTCPIPGSPELRLRTDSTFSPVTSARATCGRPTMLASPHPKAPGVAGYKPPPTMRPWPPLSARPATSAKVPTRGSSSTTTSPTLRHRRRWPRSRARVDLARHVNCRAEKPDARW